MNRILTGVNLCGVLGLAVLCWFQWQTNSRLAFETDRIQRDRYDRIAKMAEQEKSLSDDAGQLDDLHNRLSTTQANLQATEEKLRAADHQTELLTVQRDQLKASLDQWVNAVAARDALIEQEGDQIKRLAADRHDAEQRLNDVTLRYNSLAKQ